jgi:hypothetical protein
MDLLAICGFLMRRFLADQSGATEDLDDLNRQMAKLPYEPDEKLR